MKTFLFLALACLPSCTVITTENATGKATYASLGGDSKQVAISPGGATVAEAKTSLAFGKTVNAAGGIAAAATALP